MAKESILIIDDIEFVLHIKPIKNLYIRVKKDGKAHVSVPKRLTKAQLQTALMSHLAWVKTQQGKIDALPMVEPKNYEANETHYLWGKPYTLAIETGYKNANAIVHDEHIILQTPEDASREYKEKLLDTLYREELNQRIPNMIAQWENRMQVQASEWRLKKMKTRWGTCNTVAKRIWLNTELAKYPIESLEYVLVHELVHLFERSHNHRFKALMTNFLPDWALRKANLNHLAMKMC